MREDDTPVEDGCRMMGSQAMFFRWKKVHEAMTPVQNSGRPPMKLGLS